MRNRGSAPETSLEPREVLLSLGSNLGDRSEAIETALARLHGLGIEVIARSALYETEPEGVTDQPWFLNLVVRGRTSLSSRDLLKACKGLEVDLGRVPSERFGPRRIDIDILLHGTETIDEAELTVPHPRMIDRRFVLVPLVEIAPSLCDPRDGEPYARKLERLGEGKKVSISVSTES